MFRTFEIIMSKRRQNVASSGYSFWLPSTMSELQLRSCNEFRTPVVLTAVQLLFYSVISDV